MQKKITSLKCIIFRMNFQPNLFFNKKDPLKTERKKKKTKNVDERGWKDYKWWSSLRCIDSLVYKARWRNCLQRTSIKQIISRLKPFAEANRRPFKETCFEKFNSEVVKTQYIRLFCIHKKIQWIIYFFVGLCDQFL